MSAERGRDPGRAVRGTVVVLLAAVTTVVAHLLVTGVRPEVTEILVGVLLAGLVVGGTPAGRRPLTSVLAAQLVFHTVFAVSQPTGCLQAVGRAAGAGLDLALWGASSVCSSGELVVGTPQQVALLAVVSVVPLLLGHAAGALLGAAGVARLEGAVDAALTLLAVVLVRLPGSVRQLAERPVREAPVDLPAPRPSLVAARHVVRRGPPFGLTA